MSLISITGLALAMLVLAASPGPGVFATVARALASGFRPALGVIAGIVAGDLIYLLFAIFGLSMVAQAMGELFVFIKIIGGAYLVWLGIRMWISRPADNQTAGKQQDSSGYGNFASGLLITLSNPKVILFYCGFLPTFLDLPTLSLMDIVIVGIVVSTVLSFVLVTYAFLASSARYAFAKPEAVKRLNRAAGFVMIATGVTIATKT